MLFSVERAFVGRDEKQTPLKTPAWEARRGINYKTVYLSLVSTFFPSSTVTPQYVYLWQEQEWNSTITE